MASPCLLGQSSVSVRVAWLSYPNDSSRRRLASIAAAFDPETHKTGPASVGDRHRIRLDGRRCPPPAWGFLGRESWAFLICFPLMSHRRRMENTSLPIQPAKLRSKPSERSTATSVTIVYVGFLRTHV